MLLLAADLGTMTKLDVFLASPTMLGMNDKAFMKRCCVCKIKWLSVLLKQKNKEQNGDCNHQDNRVKFVVIMFMFFLNLMLDIKESLSQGGFFSGVHERLLLKGSTQNNEQNKKTKCFDFKHPDWSIPTTGCPRSKFLFSGHARSPFQLCTYSEKHRRRIPMGWCQINEVKRLWLLASGTEQNNRATKTLFQLYSVQLSLTFVLRNRGTKEQSRHEVKSSTEKKQLNWITPKIMSYLESSNLEWRESKKCCPLWKTGVWWQSCWTPYLYVETSNKSP